MVGAVDRFSDFRVGAKSAKGAEHQHILTPPPSVAFRKLDVSVTLTPQNEIAKTGGVSITAESTPRGDLYMRARDMEYGECCGSPTVYAMPRAHVQVHAAHAFHGYRYPAYVSCGNTRAWAQTYTRNLAGNAQGRGENLPAERLVGGFMANVRFGKSVNR
jgi:hypothetical protein